MMASLASPDTATLLARPAVVNLSVEEAQVVGYAQLKVKWEHDVDRDSEGDLNQWDFLCIHERGEDCAEYLSSRYMRGQPKGKHVIVAPPKPGEYCVTARDINYVLRVITNSLKDEARASKVKKQYRIRFSGEYLIPLGTAHFTVTKNPIDEWYPSDSESDV